MRKLLLLFIAIIGLSTTTQAQDAYYINYNGSWYQLSYDSSNGLYYRSSVWFPNISSSGISWNTSASDEGATLVSRNDITVEGSTWASILSLGFCKIWFNARTKAFLVQMNSVVTGVEDLNVEQEARGKARKVIENGQVVIVKDGIRYNINGARLD